MFVVLRGFGFWWLWFGGLFLCGWLVCDWLFGIVACCFGALIWGLLFNFSRFCLVAYAGVVLLCLWRLVCGLLVALVVGRVCGLIFFVAVCFACCMGNAVLGLICYVGFVLPFGGVLG